MTKTAPSDAELLKRAYTVRTKEEMKQLYHDWANSYDHTMVDGLTYNAPFKTADALDRHLAALSDAIAHRYFLQGAEPLRADGFTLA